MELIAVYLHFNIEITLLIVYTIDHHKNILEEEVNISQTMFPIMRKKKSKIYASF